MVCVSHPRAEATRQCTRCRRAWCSLCIKQLETGGRVLELCSKCSAPLGPPTEAAPPPRLDPAELVRRVFTLDGFITALAIALPGALTGVPGFGALFTVAYYAALVGYYFQIIAWVGEGREGLPGPSDAVESPGHMVVTTLRGWICVTVGTAPWLIWHYGFDGSGSPATTLGLLLVGMLYLPAVLIAVVLTSSTLGALYPVAWIQIMRRAPASYARLVGLFALSLVAYFFFTLLAALMAAWIPILGTWFVNTVANLLLFVQAALVGGFLRRHAEEFGYA
jgi:hypothetical protein